MVKRDPNPATASATLAGSDGQGIESLIDKLLDVKLGPIQAALNSLLAA